MQSPRISKPNAFTLMETVIAIGVLAVLLTGFLAVFTPATLGIRKSISIQQANRLTTTLERELVTIRSDQTPAATTGFAKAFDWVQKSNDPATPIFIYQYRGDTENLRIDGTPTPLNNIEGQPGRKYTIQSIARRIDDSLFLEDLEAIDGPLFYVKITQLIYDGGKMTLGTQGQIVNPNNKNQIIADAATYPDAVIAFAADFYTLPAKTVTFIKSDKFKTRFNNTSNKPVFSRNLAVRR